MFRSRRFVLSAIALTLAATAQLIASPVAQADGQTSSTPSIQGPIRCC